MKVECLKQMGVSTSVKDWDGAHPPCCGSPCLSPCGTFLAIVHVDRMLSMMASAMPVQRLMTELQLNVSLDFVWCDRHMVLDATDHRPSTRGK